MLLLLAIRYLNIWTALSLFNLVALLYLVSFIRITGAFSSVCVCICMFIFLSRCYMIRLPDHECVYFLNLQLQFNEIVVGMLRERERDWSCYVQFPLTVEIDLLILSSRQKNVAVYKFGNISTVKLWHWGLRLYIVLNFFLVAKNHSYVLRSIPNACTSQHSHTYLLMKYISNIP